MKTEKNILIAFLMNLGFSIFELFGGLYTGSVAILSDAVVADSAEEWMDNLVCRISDKNRLGDGNLTAVTMIVRSGD